MNKADQILKKAQAAARWAKSWADLSNVLFAPFTGLVTAAYPVGEERKRFMKTKQYRQIQDLVDQAIKKHGLVEGATPTKSGRFVVRMPRSLHAALEMEAEQEGVSLNQLVVAKLAAQLHTVAPSRARKKTRSA